MKLAWLVLLAAVVPLSTAAAQSDEARQAFREGVSAFRQENYEEARELFARAYELSERPAILVNLGSAQRQTGQLLEARASYQRFMETSDDARLKRRVQSELDDVIALIPQLTIRVENLAPNDVVTVDGSVLTNIEDPFETNPGWREVQVTRGERVLASMRVNVEPEGREEVSLTVPEMTDTRDVAEQAVQQETVPVVVPNDDDGGSNVGMIVGATVGGVAVVVAVVLAIVLAGGGDNPYQGNVPPGSVPVP